MIPREKLQVTYSEHIFFLKLQLGERVLEPFQSGLKHWWDDESAKILYNFSQIWTTVISMAWITVQ